MTDGNFENVLEYEANERMGSYDPSDSRVTGAVQSTLPCFDF